MLVVLIIGTVTALLGATIACTATDLKQVVAYSTVSQLGYMFAGLGAGVWIAAIFHLFTHAFFKGAALPRLRLGVARHARPGGGRQGRAGHSLDGRPRASSCRSRRSPSSSARWPTPGIVPFAGFWSKDEIIGGAIINGYPGGRRPALDRLVPDRLLYVPPGLPGLLQPAHAGTRRRSTRTSRRWIMPIPLVILAGRGDRWSASSASRRRPGCSTSTWSRSSAA